jgi:hypothetical protein
MCYQLELLDASGAVMYTYSFDSFAPSYTFRTTADATFAALCSLPMPALAPIPAAPELGGVQLQTRSLLQTSPPPRPPPPAICATALGKKVRYVTLSWTGNCSTPSDGYLNFAELQYFQMGNNIAYQKPTTSSSAYSGGWVASHGVDGGTTNQFCTAGAGANEYWRVDLGVRCCQCRCIACNSPHSIVPVAQVWPINHSLIDTCFYPAHTNSTGQRRLVAPLPMQPDSAWPGLWCALALRCAPIIGCCSGSPASYPRLHHFTALYSRCSAWLGPAAGSSTECPSPLPCCLRLTTT